jgi:hypothetical protein
LKTVFNFIPVSAAKWAAADLLSAGEASEISQEGQKYEHWGCRP